MGMDDHCLYCLYVPAAGRRMTTRWRTRTDTPLARVLGVEAYTAVFEHRDDRGGAGNVVAIQIPETPSREVAKALQLTRSMRARIVILADSEEQVEATAAFVSLTCAQHQRVPIERAAAEEFSRWPEHLPAERDLSLSRIRDPQPGAPPTDAGAAMLAKALYNHEGLR